MMRVALLKNSELNRYLSPLPPSPLPPSPLPPFALAPFALAPLCPSPFALAPFALAPFALAPFALAPLCPCSPSLNLFLYNYDVPGTRWSFNFVSNVFLKG